MPARSPARRRRWRERAAAAALLQPTSAPRRLRAARVCARCAGCQLDARRARGSLTGARSGCRCSLLQRRSGRLGAGALPLARCCRQRVGLLAALHARGRVSRASVRPRRCADGTRADCAHSYCFRTASSLLPLPSLGRLSLRTYAAAAARWLALCPWRRADVSKCCGQCSPCARSCAACAARGFAARAKPRRRTAQARLMRRPATTAFSPALCRRRRGRRRTTLCTRVCCRSRSGLQASAHRWLPRCSPRV